MHEEKKISFHGFDMFYHVGGQDKGDMPPIIMINGGFQSMGSWGSLARNLMGKTKVLLADLPGVGKADFLPHDYGLDFLAEAALRAVDDAGFDKVYAVSFSYGTPTAYTLARSYPERVSRLALAGAITRIPEHDGIKETIESSVFTIREDYARFVEDAVKVTLSSVGNGYVERRDIAERILRSGLRSISEDGKKKYIANTLRLLSAPELDLADAPPSPALIFTGEHDSLSLPQQNRDIACRLPGGAYAAVMQADHFFHLEQPQVTADIISAFGRGRSLEGIDGCVSVDYFGRN